MAKKKKASAAEMAKARMEAARVEVVAEVSKESVERVPEPVAPKGSPERVTEASAPKHGVDDLTDEDRAMIREAEEAVSMPESEPETTAEKNPDEAIAAHGRKVAALCGAIDKLAGRLNMDAEARIIALAYSIAECVVVNDLAIDEAWAYVERWHAEFEQVNLRVGDVVVYRDNGARGVVSGWDEANGWAIVKWDHAPASPALPAMLAKAPKEKAT